jgi:limonene-1,2-epoxide hydrolase
VLTEVWRDRREEDTMALEASPSPPHLRELNVVASTPQEVFQRHVAALSAGDLDALVADYTDDTLVLTPTGEYRGRAAVRELFAGMLQALPEVVLEAQVTAFAADALLLHWTADSTLNHIPDGVDTFVFEDGAIRLQTISCTMTPKS